MGLNMVLLKDANSAPFSCSELGASLVQAMILAGGLSTRLYPLTRNLPKPLVPLLNRPVMAHVIEQLSRQAIRDITMNVHYLADAIVAYAGDGSRFGVHLAYLREQELSGSAGAVKKAASHFDAAFVVVACDTIVMADLPAALEFHKDRNADVTIVLAPTSDPSSCGVAVTDARGRIEQFQEKPAKGTEKSTWGNTGVYILEPHVLERIPDGTVYDFGTQLFPSMAASRGRLFGMRQDVYWCDLGSPQSYRRLHSDALRGVIQLRYGEGRHVVDGVLTGCAAKVSSSARLIGPTCIGDGCRIDEGSTISSSILWQDVHVERNSVVEDAVVARPVVAFGSVLQGGEYV